MNIVVLISGNGSNLQALIDAQAAGRFAGNIAGVISNKANAFGLQRARQHNIATQVVEHTNFSSRESFDHALQAAIDDFEPDLVVLAGFMRILSDGFVDHYHGRLINIHPSLLPKYKGLETHARALTAGDTQHGCSVHYVTPELDSGAIIAQAKMVIAANETPESLSEKIQALEHQLYPYCVALLCSGAVQLHEDGVYYRGNKLSPCGLDLADADW